MAKEESEATMASSVLIETIDRMKEPKRFEKEFVLFPWKIYRSKENRDQSWAKAWCPPLIIDHMDRFSTEKNVKLKRITVQPFLAKQGGKVVGRITAQINHGHNEHFKEEAGFFGYFESISDRDVAFALFNAAAEWVKARGAKSIRGPFNFSVNDDWGWKCDLGPDMPGGFDIMPMVYQPHNPPYYNEFALAWGMTKLQDHLAYHLDSAKPLSDKMYRVAQIVEKRAAKEGKISYRCGDLSKWDREVALVREIHTDAWVPNWGQIPFNEAELAQDAKDLKMIIEPFLIWFVFVGDEPAGFIMGLPDVNEIQSKINGRLLPFGLLRLLWKVKVSRKWTRGRCVLLGMKRKFQGRGLEAPLVVKLFDAGRQVGIRDIETSWILESNRPMRTLVEPFSDRIWMSYRSYQKAI